MTEAVVSYLINKANDWLTKESSLPENIKNGISKLKSELEMIRAFLRDNMDAQKKHAHQIQVWIQQHQDVAYNIETVLDMYEYRNARQKVPWHAKVSRSMRSHSIASLIEEIETQLKNIYDRSVKYPMDFSSHPASTSSYQEAGMAPLYTPEEKIVGFEEPRRQLVSWVLDVEKAYKAMFVVGMGGSGKTALAKLVYEQLKMDFSCHVWLTATKFEQGQALLSTMVDKLCNQTGQSSSISPHTLEGLIDRLNYHLQHQRYLIVLDDLWNRKVWESVTYALPRTNRSRVIITTRRGDIASSCRDNFVDVYKVQPLSSEKAEELFHGIAYPESARYPSAPPSLPVSFKELLKECEGLPLGINEIGKLLSNSAKSEFELNKLHKSLQAELELDTGRLSNITQALLLSTNKLPHHLKDCFLYMSTFPADYVVKRRMLIRLWIAEGFIDEVNGKTLEDIGEEYLKELIDRNLIQASELDFDGRLQTCRLHNLMHKIALSKSEAESFFTTRGDSSKKTRRLSIWNSEFNMPNKFLLHAHTLITSSLGMKIQPGIISSMRLLKILHLDHARVEALPSGIDKLFLLKYLSLRKTRIKLIPESIGRLQLLETLDLKQTFVTGLPNTLDKLEKLRHLLVYRYNIDCHIAFDTVQGVNVQTEISKLTNLQKLSFVKADRDHRLIQGLQKLTELRKLGIIDLPRDSGSYLCETIQMLTNLHSLSIRSRHSSEVLNIQEINSPPPFLQRLYLWGHLEKMPHWISKIRDLERIHLNWSRLSQDNNPMTILGRLPNLLKLQLLDAYTGNHLDFNVGTFLNLKILEFERMEELKTVRIDEGALPTLQKLTISNCQKLKRIPVGIGYITQLKELHLSDMPSHLSQDNNPMTILGRLPNLLKLQLLDTYTGNHLDFNAGTFLKLKILEFGRMEELKTVRIDKGALPSLQKLTISNCQKLKRIPEGIGHITQLKELHLSDMPSHFVDPLRRNGQLRHLVQHIREISSRHLQNDLQWAQEFLS